MAIVEKVFGDEGEGMKADQARRSASLPSRQRCIQRASCSCKLIRVVSQYNLRSSKTKAMLVVLFGGILLSIGIQIPLAMNSSILLASAAESGEAVTDPADQILTAPGADSVYLSHSVGPEHNADWEPTIRKFEGIEMVLVPAGCFMMGSEAGSHDEKPVHRQCFDEPFWIDRTEVTNGQHGSRGYWPGQNRPRENISWFLAQDFCRSRGGRLPTEAEWEYAARGPDSLEYPWGNDFDGSKIAWYTFETVDVAGKPEGASWVGALDMSGGVWEWVSSVYKSYPYDPDDGREVDTDINHVDARVLRGGSWELTDADNLRAANRFSAYADDWGYGVIGFRCVRSD